MKKAALAIVTAFVFLVAMAVAQSSTGQDQGSTGSQGTTSSSPSTSSPSTSSPSTSTPSTGSSQDQTGSSTSTGSSSTMGSQSGSSSTTGSTGSTPDQGTAGSSTGSSAGQGSSGSMGSSSGSMAGEKASKGGEKTLKGCIKSEGGQTVLEEKKGKEVNLTGSDLSAHAGHEVKVHGMWEKGGSSSAASSGGSSSGKTFNVTSVDMVSDTCSMGKSSKMDHMKGGSSSSTGSQTAPPQR